MLCLELEAEDYFDWLMGCPQLRGWEVVIDNSMASKLENLWGDVCERKRAYAI